MPPTQYPARVYQTTDADSADPYHQVVLLFDAAVRFLHNAREAMDRGDYECQCEEIIRAQRIFSTLMASLDVTVEPQFTHPLWYLYNHVQARLAEAGMQGDLALMDETLALAASLRDAWRQAEINLRTWNRNTAEQQPKAAGESAKVHK